MTDTELLTAVKTALLISGEFHDNMLMLYISEIKDFLKNAGVSDNVLNSAAVVGIVSRGVSDLWNYGAGAGNLSPYFMQRAAQLAAIPDSETGGGV